MSSVSSFIGTVLGGIVTLILVPMLVVVALVQTAFGGSFEDHMKRHLEFIFELFGIEGENVINTQVSDIRLIDDEYEDLMTQVALIHQKTQMGIIDILKEKTLGITTKYNSYFSYGKNTYYNGLPSSSMISRVFPTMDGVYVINNLYGVDSEIVYNSIFSPTKEQWVYYKLYESHDYNATTGELTYLGSQYVIGYIDYNYGTNQYDVGVYRENIVVTTTITEITITVTSIDATTDNKHTYTKVTTEVDSSIYGLSSSFTETNTDEVVPKGSEVNSYSIDEVVSAPVVLQDSPDVLYVDAFNPVTHLICQWRDKVVMEENWWCYEVGSGAHPTLDTLQSGNTVNLDMLPIVEVRNNGVNVNSDKETLKYQHGRDILNILKLDIDAVTDQLMENPSIADVMDAFIYFAIDPTDTHPTVSKMLYKIFEYTFNTDNGVTEVLNESNANRYRITVGEGNFNSALAWSNQTSNAVTGSIGPVGTYSHLTSGEDLIIRHQVLPNTYREYRVYQLFNVVMISRGGMTAAVTKTFLSGGVTIPLSYNLIDQFSPIEQMVLYAKSLRLCTYAAQITYLEWYETESFALNMKIIMYIITVVLFILTMPAGGAGAKAWLIFAGKVLLAIAASVAIQQVMKHNNPMWLKLLMTVAIAAAAAYGSGSLDAGHFLSPEEVAKIVTEYATQVTVEAGKTAATAGTMAINGISMVMEMYTQEKMAELGMAMVSFQTRYDERMTELTNAAEALDAGNVSTEFVEKLQKFGEAKAYVEGIDVMYYKAVGVQYDQVHLTVTGVYDNIFDFYDHAYKIGIITSNGV